MQNENAIYTPTPKTIDVLVYTDHHGETQATTGPAHLIQGELIGRQTAKVVGRGNLLANGNERWYQIELADGSRYSVIGEGS